MVPPGAGRVVAVDDVNSGRSRVVGPFPALSAAFVKAILEGLPKYKAGLEMCFPRGLASFGGISNFKFGGIFRILDHEFCFSTLLFIFLP